MRIETVVLIRLDPEDQMRLADMGQLELSEAMQGAGFIEHRMPSRSPECRDFLEGLEDRGIEYWLREERHFDLREIREARALRCRPQDTIHHVGLPHETLMDWTGTCEICMRVPERRGQLVVDGRLLRDRTLVAGPRGELLVAEPLAMRMIKEAVSGCLLRAVVCPDDLPQPEEDWFQVLVTSTLPPLMSPPTRFALTEDHCQACGRGGLFIDSMLYYDFDDEDLDDLNASFELIGDGPNLAPELVLSPRFYNLLLSAGARLDEPEPVVFL